MEITKYPNGVEVTYCSIREIPNPHKAHFEMWVHDNNISQLHIRGEKETGYNPKDIIKYLEQRGFQQVDVKRHRGSLDLAVSRSTHRLEAID